MKQRKPPVHMRASSQEGSGGTRGWIRRNRAEFVAAVVLVVLAAGGAGGYLAYQSLTTARQIESQQQYAQDHSYRYGVGDKVVLDSTADEQVPGMDQPAPSGFGWNGTMEATVAGVAEHPSLAAAGATEGRRLDGQPLDYDDSLSHQGDAMRYVECDLRLRNVDAEAEYPQPGLKDADHVFNCGVFKLISTDPDDTWLGEYAVWFDGQMPDSSPNGGFLFSLESGEERTLKMIYAVPQSVPVDHLALRIGSSPNGEHLVELGSQ